MHTRRVDLSLLNSGLVKDAADLEKLEGSLAVVGESGLDLRVADHLKLDIQRSVTLVEVDGSAANNGGQSQEGTSEELHFEGLSGGRLCLR